MRAHAAVLSALAALAAGVPAQEPPLPLFAATSLDSGPIDHVPGGPSLVAVGDVHVPGAAAMQLWFGAFSLPPGSRVRLSSALDNAVQWFDGNSLVDYQSASAWFNGDRVHVALAPGAGTRGNRIVVTRTRVDPAVAMLSMICGPSDARVLSSDPRVGRLDGCCTTWLVDERNLITAGHCIGGIGGQLVNFNVPLSDAAGNPQYPPPQDQYALRPGSLTSVNGGLGNDFAVMSTVRNSNTGLYPGEAQGSWFATAPGPTGAQPVTWTVTGYGISNVNATWSYAQKTLRGPRVTANNQLLQFFITVTGCNSGSPVIGATGAAHGVVTHAGCNGTGSNYGTGFGFAPFQQALDALRQGFVAGTFAVYGQGCPGAGAPPQLALSGVPDLGGSVTFTITGTDPGGDLPGLLGIGDSSTSWNGGPLPTDLAFMGLPGCALLIAPTMVLAQSTNFGNSAQTVAVPGTAALLGARFFAQYFALDPGATNPAQAVATNAGRIHLGN